jgi:hypothetical protein
MKRFREWFNINEGLSHPCIVVDVQPEYCKNNSICKKIIAFVLKQTGPVLMFVNAEEMGLTSDDLIDIKRYWEEVAYEYGYGDIDWNRFEIVDKGYGYFRSWMDSGIAANIIIATIRELYLQRKNSSDELEFEEDISPMRVKIVKAMEKMRHDPISVNWTSVSQLKRYSGAYIMGGGRNECLREVELLMNAFNIKYKRIDSLVYGADYI